LCSHVSTEQVDLSAARGTKKNPQQWIIRKRESQVDKLDQLKLKTVILHDGIGKEIHMTQLQI